MDFAGLLCIVSTLAERTVQIDGVRATSPHVAEKYVVRFRSTTATRAAGTRGPCFARTQAYEQTCRFGVLTRACSRREPAPKRRLALYDTDTCSQPDVLIRGR